MNIKSFFLSWDFLLALLIVLLLYYTLPTSLKSSFTKDLYSVGISVLSIIFSVYFAALAIIISAGDDEFVYFLEEEGHYTQIVSTFKFTLCALFIALIISIAFYAITSALMANEEQMQCRWWLISFSFIALYSLFAAANSSIDAINYASYRAKFLKQKKQ